MTPFEKVQALLLVCVEQGRITDATRPHYLALAATHFDDTLLSIAGFAATADESPEPRKWTFKKLQSQAPVVLEALRTQEPARYEALRSLYVAELKRPKKAATGKNVSLDSNGVPTRKPSLPIGPGKVPPPSKRPPVSEFERMQHQEPAALEKMRKNEPARYEKLRQEHITKLKQSK